MAERGGGSGRGQERREENGNDNVILKEIHSVQ